MVGLYLMIVAIVAATNFERKDSGEAKKHLEQGLTAVVDQATSDLTTDMKSWAVKTPEIRELPWDEFQKTTISNSLESLKTYALKTITSIKEFPTQLEHERSRLLQHFDLKSYGHSGIGPANAFANDLVAYFSKWEGNWIATIDTCQQLITSQTGIFADFIDNAKKLGHTDSSPAWPILPDLKGSCDTSRLSRDALPNRDPIDPALKVFSYVGGWLLTTEFS